MKQLAEYSSKNIYGFFKPEEICFVVDKNYEYIDCDSFVTESISEAIEYAHENEYQIFIYNRKLKKDCINVDWLFSNLIDNIEEEGLDGSYFLDCLGDNGEKNFKEMVKNWFSKILGDTWFADECIGKLKNETEI